MREKEMKYNKKKSELAPQNLTEPKTNFSTLIQSQQSDALRVNQFWVMAPRLLQNCKVLIAKTFLDCLGRRQKSSTISLPEKNMKTSKISKEEKQLIEKKHSPSNSITFQINLLQIKKNAILLLLMTGPSIVLADCPTPYSCPDNIQPFPTETNNCNTSEFVSAFNATFNFTCSLMYNLTHSQAQALFTDAFLNCVAPNSPPQTIIDQCVQALFYSNSTLCTIDPTSPPLPPPLIGNPIGFNPKLLYLTLIALAPISWLCWKYCGLQKVVNTTIGMLISGRQKQDHKNEKDLDYLEKKEEKYVIDEKPNYRSVDMGS